MTSGCSSLGYLLQAGKGQLALSNRAKPLEEVIRDEKTAPRIKALLKEIPAIKKFGEAHGLKPTRNYQEYVKLDRPAAVWVVSACEKLRFQSKEWNFPFVGAFPYLGWFDLEDARKYAGELKQAGLDVDLRGARAYSTLGWFRDPILSSMIPDGAEAMGELVNVVLHESVHATLYISGQAYFNESLASFVADKLTFVYLDEHLGGNSTEAQAYAKGEADGATFRKRFHETYESLRDLYASPGKSDAEKLSEKDKLLTGLKTELKFKRDLNNATLIQFKEYATGNDEFEAVYKNCGGDAGRFLRLLKANLKAASFSKPQQEDLAPVLQSYARVNCPA